MMEEIRKKNNADLVKYLEEKREELRGLRFGASGSGVRNTHAQEQVRKEIARIMTDINARKRASVAQAA